MEPLVGSLYQLDRKDSQEEASHLPFGLNLTALTDFLWPVKVYRSS